MISDKETNTIYFSELVATNILFKDTFANIASILKSFGVEHKFIPDTKDIWARDYMPIQVNETKYIEYRYDPDYLQGHRKGCRDLKTYPDIVCNSLKLATEKSDLILDGGNIVKSSDSIILVDKIVYENRLSYSKKELIVKLLDTFQVDKVVLIPWFTREKYGHSDGLVRFIDNKTVLLNYFYKNDTEMLNRLKTCGLKAEFIDFKVKKQDKRNWAYLNFLQTIDMIIIPKFDIDEDYQAFEQMENYFYDYKGRISQVDMTEIVKFGGALNCITWTTKE